MDSGVFVTGMLRSGTTLLGKLLGGLPDLQSFTQPLSPLLINIRRDYLRETGAPTNCLDHPLSNEQFEHCSDPDGFARYLQNRSLSAQFIRPALAEAAGYSEHSFVPSDTMASLGQWHGGSLVAFVRHYFDTHGTSEPGLFAWKEVLAETYIPYFLGENLPVMVIIRDPRDVAASLYERRGEQFIGAPRPILWMVRQWRKSVAYAHQLQGHELVKVVRYEDIVRGPGSCLADWAGWLQTAPPLTGNETIEKSLAQWPGNSSFGPVNGVSAQSVGRHADVLPPSLRETIEALCYAEMTAFGYAPEIDRGAVGARIELGPDDDFLTRPNLTYFAYSNARRQEEHERWGALSSRSGHFEPAHFLFERNYAALIDALHCV